VEVEVVGGMACGVQVHIVLIGPWWRLAKRAAGGPWSRWATRAKVDEVGAASPDAWCTPATGTVDPW
jgi:hypothetical protein